MRIPAKVTYALLLSTLLVSCCLNTGSIEPVEENEQIPLEDLVIYEATEGRDDDSTAIGIAVVGLVVVAAVPLPIAAGIMYVWASSLADEGPSSSPVGRWVDNTGVRIQFEFGGSVAFVEGEPEDIDYDWSTSGNTFTLEMEMDGEDGVMMYTSKWKYDIISDDDHGDILYMSQREITIEEDGESSTQTFEDGGDCMFLVKESALPDDWDGDTMDDIAEDIDPPSWCNMDYEDQYEDQSDQSTRNVYNAVNASEATTNNTNDHLILLDFSFAEDDLTLAFVNLRIEIGDAVYFCGFDGGDECQIYEQGVVDGKWSMNETILLREGGYDLVGEGGAEVHIYIDYRNLPVSGDSTIQLA